MNKQQIIKATVPTLLFITTLFPVYVVHGETQAVNLYHLLPAMPLAILVPALFLASIFFAVRQQKHALRYSALLAFSGIIASVFVNAGTDTSTTTPEPYASILILLYFPIAPLFYLVLAIHRLRRRKQAKALALHSKTKKTSEMHFLAMPTRRLYLLWLVTGGLYALYWFYQNWKAVQEAKRPEISPFWRAAFSIFFMPLLFKEILANAKKHGYRKNYSPALLFTLYLAIVITTMTISLAFGQRVVVGLVNQIVIALISPLIFLPVQQAINHSTKSQPAITLRRKLTSGEIAIVAIGAVMFGFGILSTIHPPRMTFLASLEEQTAKLQVDVLTEQYNKCSSELVEREKTIDPTNQNEVEAYNKAFDTCEKIRLNQNSAVDSYNALINR